MQQGKLRPANTNMMAARKRRRENPCAPAAIDWTLPADLLLETVVRSDVSTLVRFAASCKLLRHEILRPPFTHHVTQQKGSIVPPCILAYLNTTTPMMTRPIQPPLSLVHPATPAAASFLNENLSPYLSCFADDLLGEYCPVTSRGGIVLLRRRHISSKLSNLCVYDPITGQRTFLSHPQGTNPKHIDMCVLLTSADGIDCSFLLFLPHHVAMPDGSYSSTIEVEIATPTCGTWGPTVSSHRSSEYGFFFQYRRGICRDPVVVLQGAVIHRLVRQRGEIVSYNVCTTEQGKIKLPDPVINFKGKLHLRSYYSHEGKNLLRLLTLDMFKISVWDQLSSGDWASEAVVINVEGQIRSLDLDIRPAQPITIDFRCYSEGSSAVLLRLGMWGLGTHRAVVHTVLDLETTEMRVQDYSTRSSVLLEVDLPSRLRAMKTFP